MAAKRPRLSAARKTAGHTQESLAEALGVDRSTVGRWEAGETEPQPWLRPKLARLLGVTGGELGELLAAEAATSQPQSVGPPLVVSSKGAASAPPAVFLPTPPTSAQQVLLPLVVDGQSVLLPLEPKTLVAGDSTILLGELKTTVSSCEFVSVAESFSALDFNADELHHVAAALKDARRYMDGSVVDYFRRRLDACAVDDGTLGPTKVLPTVLGILGAIERRVLEVKLDVRRKLLSVGALGAELAGWLYRDIHHPQRAVFWYSRATEWAQEAGDTAKQGYILLKKSQMAYDARDSVRVLTLAQAAKYGPWQLSRSVRAEVTQQEARGLAMVGEPINIIEQKLDEARRLLADVTGDDEQSGQLGSCYNDDTLTLRNASCYIEAGKPQRAAELYAQVLSADLLSRRDRGYFLARLASSLALAGEPDQASRKGLEAAQLATATTSRRTKRELIRALATLKPWHNRPGPRELRETLAASAKPVTNPQ